MLCVACAVCARKQLGMGNRDENRNKIEIENRNRVGGGIGLAMPSVLQVYRFHTAVLPCKVTIGSVAYLPMPEEEGREREQEEGLGFKQVVVMMAAAAAAAAAAVVVARKSCALVRSLPSLLRILSHCLCLSVCPSVCPSVCLSVCARVLYKAGVCARGQDAGAG